MKCKILTIDDGIIVPKFVEIMRARLNDIEPLYPGDQIEKARKLYTQDYVLGQLRNSAVRFVGCFQDENLEGVLVESSDVLRQQDFGIRQNAIKWVMARQSGMGVGNFLVKDSIARAGERKEDVVSLGVSQKNLSARKFYERLGFEENITYDGGNMILLCHYLNPEVRPR